MKKLHSLSCMIIIIGLLFVVPIIMTEVSEESNFFDHYKIGRHLITELPEVDQNDLVDVIISGEFDDRENSILQFESLYGDLNVEKMYSTVNGFKAYVTQDQIECLVLEKDVKSIISSNAPLEPQIDDAISESNIDDLYSSPYSLDGAGITVAVIDSGCYVEHESFDEDQIVAFVDVTEYPFIVNDESPIDGYDNGANEHGTSMASIIAGTGYYEGVAPGAELVIVCVKDSSGMSDIAYFLDACDWIADEGKADYGIDIVSISLSTGDALSAHANDPSAIAVDSLVVDEGLVCVVAAGNRATEPRPVRTPGSAQYAITVGNVQDPHEGGWAKWYSSRIGPTDYSDTTPEGYYKPDIMAPGVNILCAEAEGGYDSYYEITGTSPATAFVAGVVALLLEYDGDLAGDSDNDGNPDVKQLLWGPAVAVTGDSTPGFDNDYGCGRIDGLEIMAFLDTDISGTRQTAPTVFSGYVDCHYTRYDEPMWRIDPVSKEDWYKVVIYGTHIITVEVMCAPDLMVALRLYDNYLNVDEDISSIRGDDCSVTYSAGGTKTYYIRVKLGGINGVQGWPGDWYDITIDIVGS